MFVNYLSAPKFGDSFWQPYQPAAAPPDRRRAEVAAPDRNGSSPGTGAEPVSDAGFAAPDTDTAKEPGAPIRYTPQSHGAHADFCRGPGFQRYKEEVRAQLSFLADFCRTQQAPDAARIADNLHTFFRHRFDEHHFFDTRTELVDSIGKESLDEFCWMIRHGSMDAGAKQAAIRDLATGVTLCADGALSHLASAARKFALSTGGLPGKLWETKEDVARDTVHRLVRQCFEGGRYYTRNEIHYINTALNATADRFGLAKDPDGITMPEALDDRFLLTCVSWLQVALTPERLGRILAESCQARFNGELSAAGYPPRGAWTPALQAQCLEILRRIGEEFGLTADDELQQDPDSRRWILRESELRLKSFLKLGEDGDETVYAVRTDPALVVLDVLRGMARLDLLVEGTGPRFLATWREADGMQAGLVPYGELAWVARAPTLDQLRPPLWLNRAAEIEPATLSDLRQYEAMHPAGPGFYDSVVAQAIRATDVEELVEMPVHYLSTPATIGQLLQRLDKDQAMAYLRANAAGLARGFADRDRQRLLRDLLHLGLGAAIPTLLEQGSDNAAKRLDTVYSLLHDDAMPRLRRSLRRADAETAVRAWYEPLRAAGLFSYAAPRLSDLLDNRHLGSSSMVTGPLHAGHAPGVAGFFFFVKALAQDPAIQPQLPRVLPELLQTTDNVLAPALEFAMKQGYAPAVKAFYTGLKDLLTDPVCAGPIRAHVTAALPDLLAGTYGKAGSGLSWAVANGRTEIITAFHEALRDFLAQDDIRPSIGPALAGVLPAIDLDGRPAATAARRQAQAAARAAWEAVLADPAVQPWLAKQAA